MRISELPQEIKELAIKYVNELESGQDSDNLGSAFSWCDTNEGFDYWQQWDSKDTYEFIAPKNYDDVILIIETKITTMSSRGFESYYLPIGILKDLIREIKEIK